MAAIIREIGFLSRAFLSPSMMIFINNNLADHEHVISPEDK